MTEIFSEDLMEPPQEVGWVADLDLPLCLWIG